LFNTDHKTTKLFQEIIRELYYGKLMSCADLSLHIDKSTPSLLKALNHLVELGFVIEQGYAPSSGGRRPLMYALQTDRMYIVSVAMDQLSTRIVTLDLANNYMTPVGIHELGLINNPHAIETLTDIISEHLKQYPAFGPKTIGIGIGMPGFVNIHDGINYTYLDAGSESLVEHLSKAAELPVFIGNDSTLVALSELKFGLARKVKEVMVINYGWGIGLGMIVNGHIFSGNNGFAGEFSHIPITEDGALCSCGKQGCLEAEASLLAVTETALLGIKEGRKSVLQEHQSQSKIDAADAFMEAIVAGDPFAVEVLSESAYKIGRALSILIHIMNPKTIVISGRGVKIAKFLLAPIQQALNKYCIPRLSNESEVLISEIGLDAELIGAAILVMENFNA
jgi:predicted NBD/HSP70 family sugar kinase